MRHCRQLRFLWASIPLFRAFGVPVQIHTTAVVFPWGFFLWNGWEENGLTGLAWRGLAAGLLCGCILIHEFAHVLAARQCGWSTRRVLLVPFGCLAQLEKLPEAPGEIWMALAGPLASAGLGLLAYGGLLLMGSPSFLFTFRVTRILMMLCVFNLLVACFNLLPCFPMDGGRILRSSLAVVIGRVWPRRAATAFVLATRICVRYVARALVLLIALATLVYAPLWPHLLLLGFMLLAGEAEFFVLRETPSAATVPLQLKLRPARLGMAPPPVRPRRRRRTEPARLFEIFAQVERPHLTGLQEGC